MKIKNINIGLNYKPFVIAEMSGNHNQSLDRAIEIVDEAAKAGAHAIKLQTYTADTMTIDESAGDFTIRDKKSLWTGEKMYDLYKKAHTPWEWHKPIMNHAKKKGLICFSSPFDESAVDFLETLNVPAYKIASFECIDIPLIKKVAKTKKPMIISTGLASLQEISEAYHAAKSSGCEDLVLLKCTSTYPALPTNTNLMTIPALRTNFDCEIGLSDHTMGIGASIAAVALGASVIEKHFTLDREDGGVDSKFSIEPHELRALVEESERAWQALGVVKFGPTKDEDSASQRRRSIYIVKDMNEGEKISKENIKRIRPGKGLPPKYFDIVMGMKLNKSVKKGTPVSWDLFTSE